MNDASFAWEDEKAQKKHSVSFDEGATIFNDLIHFFRAFA